MSRFSSIFYPPFLFRIPILIFAFHKVDRRFALGPLGKFSSCPFTSSRAPGNIRESSRFLISHRSFFPPPPIFPGLRSFEIASRSSASSLGSTSRRLSSTWVVRWRWCQSKSLSVDPNALDCARAISSSSFSLSLLRERTRGSARMLCFHGAQKSLLTEYRHNRP